MIVNSNIPQNPIWIRDLKEDGNRRITLRRNFVAELVEDEQRITFEEVDILLNDSADLADIVRQNFDSLFDAVLVG